MTTPQAGIFALGTRAHHHLEFDLTGDVTRLVTAVGNIRSAADAVLGVNIVVGFGPRVLLDHPRLQGPDLFNGFDDITGADGWQMPGTQHDLWIWLHGGGPDALLDLGRNAVRQLTSIAVLATDQPSFVYRNSQDLTGFEDGTENPPIDEAMQIATVADGEPGAGGSVVLLQRWVHDLDSFEALDVESREQVIGRTLDGSIELDGDLQPDDSHVSRVVIEDEDGDELEVFRRSTAFGTVGEHGLVFVGFSADQDRLQRMLDRMAGVGDGVRDRLTIYSTPTSSSWYFAPSIDALR